ncbi:MAG: queuosine precursor transporter [Bacteroidales bacterium]|nr:queuosine precursor transporter [Bacteroidales bacterium]MBN2762117.1 queuosine precursor transporter [Bacteroidales bacterium]
MTAENAFSKNYHYLDILVAFFVAVLLISNIASTKILSLWKFTFDGGTILFPLSYIFGDILTEVYGYKRSRRVIWLGFASAVLMSLVFYVVQLLPPAADWPHQEAFKSLLGFVPRIVLASLIAYFAGEFSNSFTLSKLKIFTSGRFLWLRTISSTLIGQGLDTVIFCLIAFYGTLPGMVLVSVIISNYIFKCSVEILFTPLTYAIVNFLKKKENEDFYDVGVNYNPFRLSI